VTRTQPSGDQAGRTAWLDLSSGVAGDMLLGALVGAGVPFEVLRSAVGSLGLPVTLQQLTARRGGLAATWVLPLVNEPQPLHRPWITLRALLEGALEGQLRADVVAVFSSLAEAEAVAHGIDVDTVVFHEVGALDAIADIVGTCAGLRWLRDEHEVSSVHATPIALGGGSTASAHGELPVPAPAVLELLARRGVPSHGGPVDHELATPTGVALVVTLVAEFGAIPALEVEAIGVGAGSREISERPNVVRLVIGRRSRRDRPGHRVLLRRDRRRGRA
jgi:uncharacterized protein (DUF111 family)